MYVSLESSLKLIFEDQKLDITRDDDSVVNRFATKPQGILIQDSFNNPFFPIYPLPRIDTARLDLIEIKKRYRELYSPFDTLFLPWHFCIEMVDDRYFVFNTRPLDTKFPLTNEEAKSFKRSNFDTITNDFFKNNLFDISEAIHVCIIGDTNLDVYTLKMYELIGRACISPIIRLNKLSGAIYSRIFPINIGTRFNLDLATKFIHK